MKNSRKVISVVLGAVLLSSCANRYASSGEHLYLASQNGTMIVVPAPLTSANIGHLYDLPQQTANPRISIKPPV